MFFSVKTNVKRIKLKNKVFILKIKFNLKSRLMYISSNLKYLRSKRGLTQTGLAEKLGKTSAAISDYEKGKSTPPMEVAFRISELFGITIDDFARKDLQKEDILFQAGVSLVQESEGRYTRIEIIRLEERIQTLERLNELQEQRLADLEWMIRKHAPELAKEIGLLKE